MPLIQPFRGLRPVAEFASAVIAPPYDVLNSDEARLRARGLPCSFLHISKPEIDLPEGTDPYAEEVYKKGANNLLKLINEKFLIRDEKPYYYVYRLIMAEHSQIGLVAVASVADYDTNRIRKHEFTQPDKEDDRVRQISALNTQTGPVFLTYRHDNLIDKITHKITTSTSLYDLTADDGVRHTIWLVSEEDDIKKLSESFDNMNCLYIADGHHRSASASRIAAQRNEAKEYSETDSHNYFLSVIFPDSQMQILDYNRVVVDLNGFTVDELVTHIKENFSVETVSTMFKPKQITEIAMYLKGQWYRLQIRPELIPEDDPVASLDISLLQNFIIGPLLGIKDQRRDKRIDFIGGIRGLVELVNRVDSGEMKVAFALYPTSLDQLMDVADANKVMPPKSTWFEPKLADGLLSHVLD